MASLSFLRCDILEVWVQYCHPPKACRVEAPIRRTAAGWTANNLPVSQQSKRRKTFDKPGLMGRFAFESFANRPLDNFRLTCLPHCLTSLSLSLSSLSQTLSINSEERSVYSGDFDLSIAFGRCLQFRRCKEVTLLDSLAQDSKLS